MVIDQHLGYNTLELQTENLTLNILTPATE